MTLFPQTVETTHLLFVFGFAHYGTLIYMKSEHMAFNVCLPSLSNILPRFIRVEECVHYVTPFRCRIIFHCIELPHFIHPFTSWCPFAYGVRRRSNVILLYVDIHRPGSICRKKNMLSIFYSLAHLLPPKTLGVGMTTTLLLQMGKTKSWKG